MPGLGGLRSAGPEGGGPGDGRRRPAGRGVPLPGIRPGQQPGLGAHTRGSGRRAAGAARRRGGAQGEQYRRDGRHIPYHGEAGEVDHPPAAVDRVGRRRAERVLHSLPRPPGVRRGLRHIRPSQRHGHGVLEGSGNGPVRPLQGSGGRGRRRRSGHRRDMAGCPGRGRL